MKPAAVVEIKFTLSKMYEHFILWTLVLTNVHMFCSSVQAASSLKQHESLRPCKRCGSPATHSPEVQRATCTRQSCLFDFCTHCQQTFHGSTPCRVVQPRTHVPTPIIPGSARSKRNIRRLWCDGALLWFYPLTVLNGRVMFLWNGSCWLPPKIGQRGMFLHERGLDWLLDVHKSVFVTCRTLALCDRINLLKHLLQHCWDNQPESVIWLKLLSSVSDKHVMPKKEIQTDML